RGAEEARSGHALNRAAGKKPEFSVRSGRDAPRWAKVEGKFDHVAAGADATDSSHSRSPLFREPQVAIGTRYDGIGKAIGRGGRELGDDPVGGHAPNLARPVLGKPHVSVRPDHDRVGLRRIIGWSVEEGFARRRRNRKLRDKDPGCRHQTYPV